MRAVGRSALSLTAVLILTLTGLGWAGYHTALDKIIVSHALPNRGHAYGQDDNILVIGLDSRLDQHGQPLPQAVYEALHAGDESSGGYNANVLMVVHIPADGGPLTAVSIPRDDYVALPGCPESTCEGKIKEAYGLAYRQSWNAQADAAISSSDTTDLLAREQTAREAGRKAEINTVQDFLGITVDHFVEITLGAFFQIARVVQPITVCLNDDTSDSYSGASFHEGVQQITAAQAMAFVRQRRDENDGSFTDFDRTRRQQALVVALVSAMRHGGALSNLGALTTLLRMARDNVAVDAGLDLGDFANRAAELAARPLTFYTLPISRFDEDADGAAINVVDPATIRRIVADRFSTTTSPAPTPPTSTPVVLDVVNAASRDGLAVAVENGLSGKGFIRGDVSTAATPQPDTTVAYGSGAFEGAKTLADQLHVPAVADNAVAPHTVRLTLGTQFPADDYLPATDTAADGNAQVTTVAATATGVHAPAPTDLSQMSATNTPCVK
ncbi:LCP family protein [Mycobacterium simiae]|uniref:LCP family protein n=1 Tax=Mycobacterium simiae TaxID=1784 RepID=UPI003F4D6AEB